MELKSLSRRLLAALFGFMKTRAGLYGSTRKR